jgi:hypothetical protein
MFKALLPPAPPVRPPVITGAGQLYIVPDGTIPLVTLAGVKANEPPLQIAAVIAVIEGSGSTVTVILNVAPAQPPDVGVTV